MSGKVWTFTFITTVFFFTIYVHQANSKCMVQDFQLHFYDFLLEEHLFEMKVFPEEQHKALSVINTLCSTWNKNMNKDVGKLRIIETFKIMLENLFGGKNMTADDLLQECGKYNCTDGYFTKFVNIAEFGSTYLQYCNQSVGLECPPKKSTTSSTSTDTPASTVSEWTTSSKPEISQNTTAHDYWTTASSTTTVSKLSTTSSTSTDTPASTVSERTTSSKPEISQNTTAHDYWSTASSTTTVSKLSTTSSTSTDTPASTVSEWTTSSKPEISQNTTAHDYWSTASSTTTVSKLSTTSSTSTDNPASTVSERTTSSKPEISQNTTAHDYWSTASSTTTVSKLSTTSTDSPTPNAPTLSPLKGQADTLSRVVLAASLLLNVLLLVLCGMWYCRQKRDQREVMETEVRLIMVRNSNLGDIESFSTV